jgi:predicted nucleic acid-binding protein
VASERRRRVADVGPRRATLVDSNVLLDVLTDDPAWAQWSGDAIARAMDNGRLVINPIVYAAVSVGFDRIEDLDDALPDSEFEREALPYNAGFLAGKAYLAYRRLGGTRRSPLPDFYIGAHAAVRGYWLLTRDARSYLTYFPGLHLLAP